MALTATEQLQIMSGEVKPPETDLNSLVLQTAAIEAKAFYDDYKVFDGTTELEAESYLNKMLGTCDRVFSRQGDIVNLTRIIVTILGEANFTLAQIEGANQAAWEGFVTANMMRTFELFSRVRKDEATAYAAL